MNTGKIIILEGNIAAGKSTLAKSLGAILNARVFFEPTVTNPYLEKFYENPTKYALKMQLYLLRQRYNTYLSALKHTISTGQHVILDRSIYSDLVFAITNVQQGNIDDKGYALYQKVRQEYLRNIPIPDVTLFLNTCPRTCFKRVAMRARTCETTIPLDYLTDLHNNYIDFVQMMGEAGSTVCEIPWDNFGDSRVVCDLLKSYFQ
ncbi:hypothetical protein RCL1_003665 [Eukaryota sp. TZLM3-RCL]